MKSLLFALPVFLCNIGFAFGAEMVSCGDGGTLVFAGNALINASYTLVDKPWKNHYAIDVSADVDGLGRKLKFECDEGVVGGSVRYSQCEDGSFDAIFEAVATNDCHVVTGYFSLRFPIVDFMSGKIVADDKELSFPEELTPRFLSRKVSSLTICDRRGREALRFRFPSPVMAVIQDNRRFNGASYELRFLLPVKKHGLLKGVPVKLTFNASRPGGFTVTKAEAVERKANSDWIPLKPEKPWIEPGSALDLYDASWFVGPVGRYGRVLAKGEHFEFERLPGTAQRFYGVNLCKSACYPPESEAKTFAANLRRFGYNSVRIHHHDAAFFSGGKCRQPKVDEAMAKRLDALLAALYEEGIYVTTDLYVSRPVTYNQLGIDRKGILEKTEYKELVLVSDEAYGDFIDHARAFLSRTNVFTGRRYAEEPGLAFLSLINEGNLGNRGVTYFKNEAWSKAWNRWLDAHPDEAVGVSREIPESIRTQDRHVATFMRFLGDTEAAFAKKVKRFLREEMRCQALVTDMNGWTNPTTYHLVRRELYDYFDNHRYVDHPQFLGRPWKLPTKCPSVNTLKLPSMGMLNLAQFRMFEMPYTVSEFNYTSPGRFRASGGIVFGAQAALQDWAAMWRFAWSHSDAGILKPETCPCVSFDLASDPLNLASDRQIVTMFLRRDLESLPKRCVIAMDAKDVEKIGDRPYRLDDVSFGWIGWWYRIGCQMDGCFKADDLIAGNHPSVYSVPSGEFRKCVFGDGRLPVGGNGDVWVNPEEGAMAIACGRSAAVFCEYGVKEAGAFRVDVGETPAAVAISTADDAPTIATSRRLVVSHLTQLDNTGHVYSDVTEKTTTANGRLPMLVRNGRAEISIALDAPERFTVYALSRSGRRLCKVPSRVDGGRLSFTAAVDRDPTSATFLYEITGGK